MVDALKRYRSKGEQKVIVQRVTVNEGGKAVLWNITLRRSHAACAAMFRG